MKMERIQNDGSARKALQNLGNEDEAIKTKFWR